MSNISTFLSIKVINWFVFFKMLIFFDWHTDCIRMVKQFKKNGVSYETVKSNNNNSSFCFLLLFN